MYILIEIEHIAKEESASLTWIETLEDYDSIKLLMNNCVAERIARVIDPRVYVTDDFARVEDEHFNEWQWLLIGTEDTYKTFCLDPYAWNADEED